MTPQILSILLFLVIKRTLPLGRKRPLVSVL
jgi:hypothetical protein